MNMNINSLSQKYSVRKLDENDVDIIYDMSCKNDIFYQYHPPFVTRKSILDDMGALPPGKGYDDKFYVGFFENDSLVGLMDLILDYPEKEISFIGLFMILCLKSSGYKEIRLGVDKGNPQSYSFWTKNKFTPIREDTYILMGLRI